MLTAFLERRRVQKILANFVSPDVARQIANGTFTPPPLRERVIEFAFVTIVAPHAAHYSTRAGAVAEAALARGATVHSLIPFVVVAFGAVEGASVDRPGFIADVQSQFTDAAVVHGRTVASVGGFGSSSRLDPGFWWPGMVAAVRELFSLSPGEIRELR